MYYLNLETKYAHQQSLTDLILLFQLKNLFTRFILRELSNSLSAIEKKSKTNEQKEEEEGDI